MLTRYERAKRVNRTEYRLQFTLKKPILLDDLTSIDGYSIGCDANGVPLSTNSPEMMENYRLCMERPEDFTFFNHLVPQHYEDFTYPKGVCECGWELELRTGAIGACQCRCGRFYDYSGIEVEKPEMWDEYWGTEEPQC